MAMDDIVGTMLVQDAIEVAHVPPGSQDSASARPADEFAAKRVNFVFVRALRRELNEEVHGEALAIDVAQDVDEPGFNTSKVHRAKDVENADCSGVIADHAARLSQRLHALTITPSAPSVWTTAPITSAATAPSKPAVGISDTLARAVTKVTRTKIGNCARKYPAAVIP